MKKALTLFLLSAFSVSGINANIARNNDYYVRAINESFTEITQSQSTTYIDRAIIPSWKDNWFINISGGISSFIGSPIGCEDLFGRIKPVLQIGFGKWHTPSIGTRLVFQGFQWKSGLLENQDFRHYHADFLWNVIPSFYSGDYAYKFDVIPFVGLGLIDNPDAHTRPFAINYGIQGRFRLSKTFHITLELSNATSFKNADGVGSATQLGDNLLNLSAGVSWTFGKNVGWKKIIDPVPYIERNDRMTAYIIDRESEYENMRRSNSINLEQVGELKKILEIEGLLSKYSSLFDNLNNLSGGHSSSLSSSAYDKSGRAFNDYEGLRLLKERLRNAFGNKNNENLEDGNDTENLSSLAYNQDNEIAKHNGINKDNNKNKGPKSGEKSRKNSKKGSKNNANYSNGDKGSTGKYNYGNLHKNTGFNNPYTDYSALIDLLKDSLNSEIDISYLLAMLDKNEPVGSPIFFFFELGATNLVDSSQMVNLDEIARIAGKYGLLVNIEGAADSFTGNESINSELAINRAESIADYLFNKGVAAENIYVSSVGGIDKYSPIEANRNTVITLYLR